MNTHHHAAQFRDEHYDRRAAESPTATVNPRLAQIAGPLPPGTALELGCGAGGDAGWLTGQGWRVTALDISASALRSLHRQTHRAHAPVATLRVDLAEDVPAGTFDLVCAQYLHTPFALDRTRVLRTAAKAVNPRGRLAVVDHGSPAPWSCNQDPNLHYPTPRHVATELALDSAEWSNERADTPPRQATSPAGRTATVVDHVLVMRRAGTAPKGRR